MNLIEGLQQEMNRVRWVITEYEDIIGGAGGLAAAIMKADIQNAERCIANGDAIEMMSCYTTLQEVIWEWYLKKTTLQR